MNVLNGPGGGMGLPHLGGAMSSDDVKEMQRQQREAMDVSLRMGVMQTVMHTEWAQTQNNAAIVERAVRLEHYVRSGQ